MKSKKFICMFLVPLFVIILHSCESSSKGEQSRLIKDKGDTTKVTNEIVSYTIEGEKAYTKHYSFDIPEGYSIINNNTSYILLKSSNNKLSVMIESDSSKYNIPLEEYMGGKIKDLKENGFIVCKAENVQIENMNFKRFGIRPSYQSEDFTYAFLYFSVDNNSHILITVYNDGYKSTDSQLANELLNKMNFKTN